MQQVVILNFNLCRVDVYTIDSSDDAEDFITGELGLSLDNVYYMTKPDIIPITIHCDD